MDNFLYFPHGKPNMLCFCFGTADNSKPGSLADLFPIHWKRDVQGMMKVSDSNLDPPGF